MSPDDDIDITEDPALVGRLRTTLTAVADDADATDERWAAIEREGSARARGPHRGRIILAAILATAAVLAAVVVVRLADAPTPDPGVTTATEPDDDGAEVLDGAAPDSWARLLGKLPAGAITQQSSLSIQDLARARTQAGVEPLTATPTEDEWRAHSQALFGRDEPLYGELYLPTPAELHAELGFGPEQIDQIVTWGLPVQGGYVATGRFDPAAIAAAVAADPIWGPELDTRVQDGVTVHRWSHDARPSNKRTPVRDMGVGGQLIVGDGWIAWTKTDENAEAIIDAFVHPARSLAGVEAVRAAADSADAAGLTEIGIMVQGPEERSGSSRPAPKPDLPAIDRPLTSSGGSGRPADEHRVQFRLDYASESEAEANLAAFTATWPSITDPVPEVRRDGTGLVATFTAPDPFELTGEYVEGPSVMTFGYFIGFFNVRAEPLDRPELPDPRPTPAELLADGTVTLDEYRVAFWTFAECAESAGAPLGTISEKPDGSYSYTTDGAASDACYNSHFMQVDMAWQTSR